MTHRAYADAKDAVRHRKPPQKPPEAKEKFDHEKWAREQMALTNQMNALYNTKPPKPAAGEAYVPKQRKTQRAKQKPRTQGSLGIRAATRELRHGSSEG